MVLGLRASGRCANRAQLPTYLGRGLEGDLRTVSITSDNADAVLCLEVREPTSVDVLGAASFAALVLFTAQADVEIDVDDDFDVADGGVIHLGTIAGTFTYPEQDFVYAYTNAAWQALRLPIDPRFDAPGPGVLHVLDAAFISVSSVALPEHVRPSGTLTSWTPVSP
jgi:hypothetical protein